MLSVGQIYNKNGKDFCVLDLIDYNTKKYVLMSAESDKIEFLFFTILQGDGFIRLEQVVDKELEFTLFHIIETKKE